jgi:hypothetical protein
VQGRVHHVDALVVPRRRSRPARRASASGRSEDGRAARPARDSRRRQATRVDDPRPPGIGIGTIRVSARAAATSAPAATGRRRRSRGPWPPAGPRAGRGEMPARLVTRIIWKTGTTSRRAARARYEVPAEGAHLGAQDTTTAAPATARRANASRLGLADAATAGRPRGSQAGNQEAREQVVGPDGRKGAVASPQTRFRARREERLHRRRIERGLPPRE